MRGIFEQLDWLTKRVNQICCLIENTLVGPPGPVGPPGGFGAYASYYSTETQTIDGENLPKSVTVNTTSFQNGISLSNGSEFTFINSGIYNIAFSFQAFNDSGGGSGKTMNIWFALNGSDISESNTSVSVDTNSPYKVPAWNFFINAQAGHYVQIKWTADNTQIQLLAEAEVPGVHPFTPSVIVTINQVG